MGMGMENGIDGLCTFRKQSSESDCLHLRFDIECIMISDLLLVPIFLIERHRRDPIPNHEDCKVYYYADAENQSEWWNMMSSDE